MARWVWTGRGRPAGTDRKTWQNLEDRFNGKVIGVVGRILSVFSSPNGFWRVNRFSDTDLHASTWAWGIFFSARHVRTFSLLASLCRFLQ